MTCPNSLAHFGMFLLIAGGIASFVGGLAYGMTRGWHERATELLERGRQSGRADLQNEIRTAAAEYMRRQYESGFGGTAAQRLSKWLETWA